MNFDIQKKLEMHHEEGEELCQYLNHKNAKVQWERLSPFVQREYPNHYAQIVGVDDDGFERIGKKGGHYFYYWISCSDLVDRDSDFEELGGAPNGPEEDAPPRSLEDLLSTEADIWDFSQSERRLVLTHWKEALRQDWIDELVERAKMFEEKSGELEALLSEFNRRLLETVDVIGLTTTGLASYAPLLDRLGSKALICEEAGEVLEVHKWNLASLNVV